MNPREVNILIKSLNIAFVIVLGILFLSWVIVTYPSFVYVILMILIFAAITGIVYDRLDKEDKNEY